MLRVTLIFFFSSRRRHTRCLSDWSSDVCSSDLCEANGILAVRRAADDGDVRLRVEQRREARAYDLLVVDDERADHRVRSASAAGRSEEHTSELQSLRHLVCRLLLEKKKLHNHVT